MVEALRAWFASHKAELADNGYQTDLTDSPADRAKQSASVTIASSQRIGQLVVWDTGEAELSLGDAASGVVREEHREVTSTIGLQGAIETLMAWLAESP